MKESNLEHNAANEDPFSGLSGVHEIHMTPLMPHVPDMFNQMQMPHMEIIPLNGPDLGMMNQMSQIGELLKNKLHGLHRTGPAAEHHMGPLIPSNILTPGAHPKHLAKEKANDEKKQDKSDKKEEPKKDEHKDDAPKDEKAKSTDEKDQV